MTHQILGRSFCPHDGEPAISRVVSKVTDELAGRLESGGLCGIGVRYGFQNRVERSPIVAVHAVGGVMTTREEASDRG